MYSNSISASHWGNQQVAIDYLERYWLSLPEYLKIAKPVQDQVFINQDVGLPSIVFPPQFDLHVLRGGCLFVPDEFARLQECTRSISENFLFVIENTFAGRVKEPTFRMRFPSDISWDEISDGNFISSILLEMPHKEYFVFGESGAWGKYVANDYKFPLDVLGFKPEVSKVFMDNFKISETECRELLNVIPPAYSSRIRQHS